MFFCVDKVHEVHDATDFTLNLCEAHGLLVIALLNRSEGSK